MTADPTADPLLDVLRACVLAYTLDPGEGRATAVTAERIALAGYLDEHPAADPVDALLVLSWVFAEGCAVALDSSPAVVIASAFAVVAHPIGDDR